MAQRIQTVNEQWTRVMTAARARWSKLTDDDVQDVRGNTERLITVLQVRYGSSRQQVIRELTAWRQALSTGAAA